MDETMKYGDKFPSRKNGRTGADIKRFKKQNGEIIMRLKWIGGAVLLFVLIVVLACQITKRNTMKAMREQFDTELRAAKFQVEQEVAARMREEYGLNERETLLAQIDEEAKTMAKAAYFARNNSYRGVFSVCAAIANRVVDSRYPDTVYGVCSQEGNIMGWSDSNPVVKRLYDISYTVLTQMHDGVMLIDPGFVYINWSTKEVVLLDSIERTGKVHKFYEDDWDGIIEQYLPE